jgi:hypothetical protein
MKLTLGRVKLIAVLVFSFSLGAFLPRSTTAQSSCLRTESNCTYNVESWSCAHLSCSPNIESHCGAGCCYTERGHGTGQGVPGFECRVDRIYESTICGGQCGAWDYE